MKDVCKVEVNDLGGYHPILFTNDKLLLYTVLDKLQNPSLITGPIVSSMGVLTSDDKCYIHQVFLANE